MVAVVALSLIIEEMHYKGNLMTPLQLDIRGVAIVAVSHCQDYSYMILLGLRATFLGRA